MKTKLTSYQCLVAFVFVVLVSSASAQISDSLVRRNFWTITVNPLRFMEFSNPGFLLGAQYHYGNWATQVGGISIFELLNEQVSGRFNRERGYRLFAEQRYIFERGKTIDQYVAGELVFQQSSSLQQYDIYLGDRDSIYEYIGSDEGVRNKTLVMGNVGYGISARDERFFFSFSLGLNFRWKNLRITDKAFNDSYSYDVDGFDRNGARPDEGSNFYVLPYSNFRIGILLGPLQLDKKRMSR